MKYNMLNLHLTMDPYFVIIPSSRIKLFGWWFEINMPPLIKYKTILLTVYQIGSQVTTYVK
jgi:hypothetical protein